MAKREKQMKSIAIVMGLLACNAAMADTDIHIKIPDVNLPKVSLYGTFDNSLSYVSNVDGKSETKVKSQKRWPNFLGLKGTQDLGSGWDALFKVERGILLNTGAVYNRQAWIGLSNSTWGTVTIGKQYDALQAIVPFTTAIDNTLTAEHPGDYDREAGVTLDNTIKYQRNLTKHLKTTAIYSGGDSSSSTNTGTAFGMNTVYMNGHWGGYVGAQRINGQTIDPASDLGVSTMFGADAASMTLDRQNIYAVAGMYKFGGGKVVASYSNTQMHALDQSERLNSYDLGLVYPVTDRVDVQTGYSYSKMDSYDWNIFNVSSEYKLAKNASLFVTGVYETVGEGQKAVLYQEDVSSDRRQLSVRVGFLYRFNVDFF